MATLQPDSFQVNHRSAMESSGSKIGLFQNAGLKLIIYLLALKQLSMTFPLNLFIIVLHSLK